MNTTATLPAYDTMPKIEFQTNWNKKLNCRYFTTIRLSNTKYTIGTIYSIELKNKFIFRGKIVNIKTCKLDQLQEYTACIDTGYSLDETKNLIHSMYKNYKIDWNTKDLMIVLIENLEFEN